MKQLTVLSITALAASVSFSALAQGIPSTENGCIVSRNETTGAIAARAVDPKTGEVLESVHIAGDGTPTIMRSRNGKGALFRNCDITVLNVLGRADERRIMRAAGF